MRKILPLSKALAGVVCLALAVVEPAAAARLEIRGRNPGPAGEVRIPLGQRGYIDVWMDAEGERIRTLNLFLRYDPQTLLVLDANPDSDGINPFFIGGYMPQPSQALNATLEDEGEMVLGVTNERSAAATGAGVVASFQVEVIGPGAATDLEVDFRYPLHFTSYEAVTDEGAFEKRDFQLSQVEHLHLLIGTGMLMADMPDLVLGGGAWDRSILLDDVVLDAIYADSQIGWRVTGMTEVTVEIDAARRVTIEAPDDWSGIEELVFTATSPDGLEESDLVVVTVIGPPRLRRGPTGLSDLIFDEDTSHTDFDLDDFLVLDSLNPPSDLSWSVRGQSELMVEIDPLTHGLTIAPPPEWSGEEAVQFTVSNRFGLADMAAVTVTVATVNDPPEIAALPDLKVLVDEELEGPLIEDVATDVDNGFDELTPVVSGDDVVEAEIREGRIVVRGLAEGEGVVELVVQDAGGEQARAELRVSVLTESPPEIAPLPDLVLLEGAQSVLDLDFYVTDLDTPDEDIQWEAVADGPVVVAVDERTVTLTAPEDFTGTVTITFTATDPGDNVAQADLQVTVIRLPRVDPLPPLAMVVGEANSELDLDEYVEDDSPDEALTWSVSGAGFLSVEVAPATHVVTIVAPDDAVGLVQVVFTVEDPGGSAADGPMEVTVTAPPVVDLPAEVAVATGESRELLLAGLVTDIDTPLEELDLQLSDTAIVTAELQEDTGLLVISAPAGLEGFDEEELVLTAIDSDGNTGTDRARIMISGLVAIQVSDATLVHGESVSLTLDDFVVGVDPTQIAWQVESPLPDSISAQLDPGRRVLELGATVGYVGVVEIGLVAGLPASAALRDTFLLNVVPPGPRVEIGDIPDLNLLSGQEHSSLVLDAYVVAGDPGALTWSVGGASLLVVVIDEATRQVRVTAPVDFVGSETLVFTARDRRENEDGDVVTVTVEAPPPLVQLKDIPDLSLIAGETEQIVLDSYVALGTPEDLTWSVSGATLVAVTIESGTRLAEVSVLNLSFEGQEVLLLTATDGDGNAASDVVRVTVSQPLVLDEIADLVLVQGATARLSLDDYVTSGPALLLNWSVEGDERVTAVISPTAREVSLTAGTEEIGEDLLLFHALAPDGQTADAALRVVIEAPRLRLKDIPDLILRSGETDDSLALDEYVDIGAVESIVWSVSGDESLTVTISRETRRVAVAAPEELVGEEILVFTAVLDEEVSAADTVRVSILEALPPIVLADIPDLALTVGETRELALDDYVTVPAPEELQWSVSGEVLVRVIMQSDARIAAVSVTDLDAAGEEVLLFTAKDSDDNTASDAVRVTFAPAPPQLELGEIPEFTVMRGTTDSSLLLSDYLVQGEAALVTWSIRGGVALQAQIDESSRVQLDAAEALAGRELFVVEAALGEARASTPLSVLIRQPRFSLLPLPDVEMGAGTSGTALDLDDYVDTDFAPQRIAWRARPTAGLSVDIHASTHVARIAPVGAFRGEGRVVFVAETPLGDSLQTALDAHVSGPPQVGELPELSLLSGAVEEVMDLDHHLLEEVPEPVVWWVVGEGMATLTIDAQTHVLTVRVPAEFAGEETRQLAVRRESSTVGQVVDLILRVQSPNHPPVLQLPAEIVVGVEEVRVLDLDSLVDDPDTESGLLTWTAAADETRLAVQLDLLAGSLRLQPLGPASASVLLSLTVEDPDDNRVGGELVVRIVNPDTEPPDLRLELVAHQIFQELVELRIYAGEPLVGLPAATLNGEALALEDRGAYYAAVYEVGQDSLLSLDVGGLDLAGNTREESFQVALQRLSATVGTLYSADRKVHVNVPATLIGAGLLGSIHTDLPQGATDAVYALELTGGIPPGRAVEIAFAHDFSEDQATAPIILRWDDFAQDWEPLETFASREAGLLYASTDRLGRFKVAASGLGGPAVSSEPVAYPNPFNSAASIRYLVEDPGRVRVRVFDLQGNEVSTLVNRFQREGPWTAVWEGMDRRGEPVASGVYFYLVETTTQRRAGKMTFLR